MNRADARREFRVGARACRWRPLTPRIVAAGGDSQYPAHRGNPVYGLIRVHELERRDGTEPVSVANQAAAFDSISRSSRSTRFSRRSRLSSSRSAVVSPSLRSLSSSPACLTHWRIALAEASNSRANCAIGRPVRANSMIRRRYSRAYGGWVFGIGGLLLPFSPTPSTKPGQLQGQADRFDRSSAGGHSSADRPGTPRGPQPGIRLEVHREQSHRSFVYQSENVHSYRG